MTTAKDDKDYGWHIFTIVASILLFIPTAMLIAHTIRYLLGL